MLVVDEERIAHVEKIEDFQRALAAQTGDGHHHEVKTRPWYQKLRLVGRGMVDWWRLFSIACRPKGVTDVVCVTRKLAHYEKFFEHRRLESPVFVNYHQTQLVETFAGRRVLNLGILVGAFKKIWPRRRSLLRDVRLFHALWRPFRRILRGANVFVPCYYDANGLAFVFDGERDDYRLIEVQHGGMCNFEPYSTPVSFKVADTVMVWDERTASFLKSHLYERVDVNIEVVDDVRADAFPRIDNDVPVVLYCSTIEVNGVHERFLTFLQCRHRSGPFQLRVRLHPREVDRRQRFIDQLGHLGVEFEFDESKDWLTGNPYQRMVVVTPWSSVIEEAYREGIPSVILDDFGRERFGDLIDGEVCWFAEDPCATMSAVLNHVRTAETHDDNGGA